MDADVVLLGGNVITIDPDRPRAEAVGIRDGRFVLVGSDEEAREAISKKTRVENLRGMTIVPGFIDSHNHTLLFGLNLLRTIDLSSARSVGEIIDLVEKRANRQEPGTWILGFGFNHNELAEKRHPTRWDLDKAAPNHPVSLKHCAYHTQVVNSKALAIAGINRETPDPESGKIGRIPETREPTGILYEISAINMIEDKIPKASSEDLVKALEIASGTFLSEGITSATDAGGVGIVDVPSEFAAYQEAVETGVLSVRHNLAIWGEELFDFGNLNQDLGNLHRRMSQMQISPRLDSKRLRVGPVKIVADGALSTVTAATYEPYGAHDDSRGTGMLTLEPEKLMIIVSVVHRRGWQLAIHSIGDRATDIVVNAIERASQDIRRSDSRHRIEHCTIAGPQIMPRIKELGILPIAQPGFIWELGDSWFRQLDPDMAKKVKPFRTFLRNGIPLAFSSDRPVIKSAAPILGIHAAVNRKTMSGRGFIPEERISVEEALRCYTINGAYATFEENIKGSIEAGKLADLVMLNEDPTKLAPEKIKEIKVLATMVNGEFLYQNS